MSIRLSAEAVIGLVALMVSLPPAIFAVWRCMCHQQAAPRVASSTFGLTRRETPDGKCHIKIYIFTHGL